MMRFAFDEGWDGYPDKTVLVLDNEGKPLTVSSSYDDDINQYVDFWEVGIDNYKK